MTVDPGHTRERTSGRRILVSCALPLGQAVFIADPSHQVPHTCDPSPGLFSSPGDQVQRLHVFSVIQAEATVGVKAALRVPLEDLGLLALTDLSDGVDGDCQTHIQSTVSVHFMEKMKIS